MRRLIAVTAVLAALGTGASSAAAEPPGPLAQAQRLCERQGGLFTAPYPGYDFPSYDCWRTGVPFTEREFSQASRICDRSGLTFRRVDTDEYDCVLV